MMSDAPGERARRMLLHYVSLDGGGGVELQFVEFLQTAARLARTRHAVVACGRAIHPLVAARLDAVASRPDFEKYAGPIKLPKHPAAIRAAHQRRLVARHRPDAVVIWNRLRDSLDTLAAAGAERCVYWERGASWFAGESRAKRVFIDAVPAVLCNSYAARRMLELRWQYRGQVRVVPNALRPSLAPAAPAPRALPRGRTIRLGAVARLEPIKGVAVTLQAVAELAARGVDVVLQVAGDGPERARLAERAQRLGIAERVTFAGLVRDMAGFYANIDVLVHPALREPFGQIAIEANAHGVPAVVAAIDGLVEAIQDGETGLCVAPTLPVCDYVSLGGTDRDLPPFVYYSARDAIAAPMLVDPAALATAIERLIGDDAGYRQMSRAAIAAVRERFDFDTHVERALAAIDGFVTRGELAPEHAGRADRP